MWPPQEDPDQSSSPSPTTSYPRLPESFGVAPGGDGASGQQQSDTFKELVNKLAWTLGSVYKRTYSSKKGPVHLYANKVAKAIVRDHGYLKSK